MRNLLFLFCFVLCLTGCGPKLVEVTGKVTYNGEAPDAEGLHILFLGPNGQSVQGPVAATGEYKLPNVVAGPNQVSVYYKDPGRRPQSERKDRRIAEPRGGSPLKNIPAKYSDVKTSGLSVTVDTGTTFEAKLEGEPIR